MTRASLGDRSRRLLLIFPSIRLYSREGCYGLLEEEAANYASPLVADDLSRLARSSRRSLMIFLHVVANLNVDVGCQVYTIPPYDETRSRSLAFLSSRSLCSPQSSVVQSINRYFGPWLIIRWIESESGAESELLVIARRSRVEWRADKLLKDKQQIMSHANFPRNFSKPRSDPSSL